MVRSESTTPASSNTAHLTQAVATHLRRRLLRPRDRENPGPGLIVLPGQPSLYMEFEVLQQPLPRRGTHALLRHTAVIGRDVVTTRPIQANCLERKVC